MLLIPSSLSEERAGERAVEPPSTGARVAAAAGDAGAAGAATIANGAGEGGGAEEEEGESPAVTEWLAEEEPSNTADSSADPDDAVSSASPPPDPLSLTLTELLAEPEPEALKGAGVAPAASSSLPLPLPFPLPLPLPEATPTVGAGVDGSAPCSQPASRSIAAKSSVVSPAAAAAEVVLDGSLDVGSCQTLSEVPARTTEPSPVAVAAVTQSLPEVPSCNNCARVEVGR